MMQQGCNLRECLTLIAILVSLPTALGQSLEQELRAVNVAELVREVESLGDAARGAVVFFQPSMSCSKCHGTGEGASALGPDLTQLDRATTNEALVESILFPSRTIRKGFETVSVTTVDGAIRKGMVVSRNESELHLRDFDSKSWRIEASEIEEVTPSTISLMPEGQVNQLTSRQEFLDLVRYVIEVRDGGAARALALKPSAALLTLKLPEYEQHIDHAGFIRSWDKDSFKRGEAIYGRVCANCHGTLKSVGSLPTALRFAEGKFKNGHDPLSMYRTLTRGFGMMPAQTWMVPSQKYDVIHYLRETYLRKPNASQFTKVDDAYLKQLPPGDTFGPEPSLIEPWNAMDYGPTLTHTYETPGDATNLAYKGVAVRLDPGAGGIAKGSRWMIFDTDTLRVSAIWQADVEEKEAAFIDWRGIQFNGEHGIHPRTVGQAKITNPTMPGWGEPRTASFVDDQRVEGRDQRRYGPLPRSWAKYKGLYHYDQQAVFVYSVGETEVCESPGLLTGEADGEADLFLRRFNIGPRTQDLVLQVADFGAMELVLRSSQGIESKLAALVAIESTDELDDKSTLFGVAPAVTPVTWDYDEGSLRLKIAAGNHPLSFTLWAADTPSSLLQRELDGTIEQAANRPIPKAQAVLSDWMKGGPKRWKETLETRLTTSELNGPFETDTLTAPEANPWLAQMRFTGLDFRSDGRMAVSTWDGDVWLVEFHAERLRWQRIATGLFQPLGLKVIDDKIHVLCRDQLAVLHDLNGDEEIDYYHCLNNDHQVTEHFHEFAMGLQTDAAGNFYYAKSARHALPAVVPHHGTLLRIAKDGSRTDILAVGFRAANGVCLNPDGSFVVTDQEGHWNPKNRINWVVPNEHGDPRFYGNLFGYHDVTDAADERMEPPLCWITNAFDRSPAELLWVPPKHWDGLAGQLLNLSYGNGKVFVVPHERVAGVVQGGMIELPIPAFPTGVMRGRFNPQDGHLYVCGMFAWAGSATEPGGLYRIRRGTGDLNLPISIHAIPQGIQLVFTDTIQKRGLKPRDVQVKTWSLKRSANYGSKHFKERNVTVSAVKVLEDGKTVQIEIPSIVPTWCMEIQYSLKSESGTPIQGVIHNTIHALGE